MKTGVNPSFEKLEVQPAPCADRAVGVSKSQQEKWFVAVVNHKSEIKYGDKLSELGYESYVPIQKEVRRWKDGRRRSVDVVVLPSLIFLRVTESERRKIVTLPYINRFLVNRAGRTNVCNQHPIAVIPDHQMETLKFMLYNAENPVHIESTCFQVGRSVRVARGKLQGLEGNVLQSPEGESYVVVGLDILGYARVQIDCADLEYIK